MASWCERGIGSSTSSKMRRMGGEVGAGSDPPPPRPPAAERRPEDSETAVATAAKLGLSFLLKVIPCAQSLRIPLVLQSHVLKYSAVRHVYSQAVSRLRSQSGITVRLPFIGQNAFTTASTYLSRDMRSEDVTIQI